MSGNYVEYNDGSVKGRIYGGPYYSRPADMIGVKMAAEIKEPCDVDIPTVDFSVPDQVVMLKGMFEARLLMEEHGTLYAGCMGGVGRTGLFMAAMLKYAHEQKWGRTWRRFFRRWFEPAFDPIKAVREQYNSHAVETRQQEEYLRELPV